MGKATKIQLAEKLTMRLGAGANAEIDKKAALEDTEKILETLDGADMVFITTGLGGGTRACAAPVIAQLAQEIGALSVAIVTKPFWFEGKKRMAATEQGLLELRDCIDTVIEIHNERPLHTADRP